jgi:hypothetical protein
MARTRDLQTAQHEAAHVVVGVALGLRVREVAVGSGSGAAQALRLRGMKVAGYTWFKVPRADWMANALTVAAGIAWERAVNGCDDGGDRAILRRMGYRGRAVDALAAAAGAILEARGAAHARVTRALLERDLVSADIEAIARGERPGAED